MQFRGRYAGGDAAWVESDRGHSRRDWMLARDPETGALEPKRVTFAYSSIHEDVLVTLRKRIDQNFENPRHLPHGDGQAQEQRLIGAIDKILREP